MNVLRKTQKSTNFFHSIKIKVTNADKDDNKIVVTISYKMNLLIVQDLWHYQILLTISRKKSVKLNVKIVIIFFDMKVSRTF